MVGNVNFVVFVVVDILCECDANVLHMFSTYVFIFELIPQFGKLSKGGFISVDSRLTS